jgi:malate dehydrogenase (oxaloacetate-decarboxylating)(NADP+)
MEGKGVLFQKFAGIDVFDIEIAETDPTSWSTSSPALEPTFGGINLEDIKAPECFEVERKLRERMNIPGFHDDQHGTAIIVVRLWSTRCTVLGKDIGAIKLATSGAGAAGIACLDMLVSLGVKPENITVADKRRAVRAPPHLDPSLRATRATPRRARWPNRQGRRRVPRPVRRRRAEAGDGGDMVERR